VAVHNERSQIGEGVYVASAGILWTRKEQCFQVWMSEFFAKNFRF